ncbi:30S ribosomal protein S1 [Chloracidobacterium validum]|uniref:30S ribosomal protein S1 n=2 Tax=Chloracidobacterium validum TaxID=2821543 RepID=A0ABX8BAD4_9BACT|nr:30S ribosomal protein S1 [Chloracidobacterium validum]
MLDDYEQTSATVSPGDIVVGQVVSITERGVVVDIGFKSEGLVPKEEFTGPDGELTIARGASVEVMVKQIEGGDGYVELSHADARRHHMWEVIEKAFTDNQTVSGKITERTKGGLQVDLGGITAFLPGSQADIRPLRNLDALLGREMTFRILKLNKKRNNIVLSRKVLLEEETSARKAETLRLLDENVIVSGQVKNLTDYGAFIDLGGIDGLLHVTDMSWGRLPKPSDLFSVGDTVQVKVLKFDRERERVSLGYKQLLPDPWDTVNERFRRNDIVKGRVVSVTDYGAFVELEDGIEGLVHVSEMTWSKRIKHPSKLVSVGDEVEAMVLEVDQSNRRVSLGMKQIQPNPWDSVAQRYSVGSRVSGKVRNLTDFGAFVEIEDGIDGLIHVSDLSWTKRVKHPSDVLKKGQIIEAIITSIDTVNRRLSLSIKDLEPNAWERFFQNHRLGDVVTGKVVRIAGFGVFVEIEEGIEGLCHISELSDQRIDRAESVVSVGQVLPFKILKLDEANRKIGLSARAVGKENDPEDVSNYLSSETMTSLGELARFVRNEKESR